MDTRGFDALARRAGQAPSRRQILRGLAGGLAGGALGLLRAPTATARLTATPPLCPADLTLGTDPGLCGALVTYSPPASASCSPPPDAIFPVGTSTVICFGSGVTCSFTVTVLDAEPPAIACPADLTVPESSPGAGSAVVTYSATGSDNCDGLTPTCTPESGSSFLVGSTIVTCTATDPTGNTASCSFAVTVTPGDADGVVDRNFVAHLTGAQEVPPVDTAAQGQAIFHLSKDGTALGYRLVVANIEDVVAAHIHLGAAGVNGPVVAFLFEGALDGGRTDGVLATGTIMAANLVGPLAGQPLSALIAEIREGDGYANVHTTQYPGGEIRGQIGRGTGEY